MCRRLGNHDTLLFGLRRGDLPALVTSSKWSVMRNVSRHWLLLFKVGKGCSISPYFNIFIFFFPHRCIYNNMKIYIYIYIYIYVNMYVCMYIFYKVTNRISVCISIDKQGRGRNTGRSFHLTRLTSKWWGWDMSRVCYGDSHLHVCLYQSIIRQCPLTRHVVSISVLISKVYLVSELHECPMNDWYQYDSLNIRATCTDSPIKTHI